MHPPGLRCGRGAASPSAGKSPAKAQRPEGQSRRVRPRSRRRGPAKRSGERAAPREGSAPGIADTPGEGLRLRSLDRPSAKGRSWAVPYIRSSVWKKLHIPEGNAALDQSRPRTGPFPAARPCRAGLPAPLMKRHLPAPTRPSPGCGNWRNGVGRLSWAEAWKGRPASAPQGHDLGPRSAGLPGPRVHLTWGN